MKLGGLSVDWFIIRVSDVRRAIAHVEFTTTVPITTSGCSEIETVPSARRSGMGSITLAREPSRTRKNTSRARGGVVVLEGCSRKLSKRSRRTRMRAKRKRPEMMQND